MMDKCPNNRVAGPFSQFGTINPHFGIPCTVYFGRRAAFHEEELHVPGIGHLRAFRLQKHDKNSLLARNRSREMTLIAKAL
jgi:hypothetical protein